MGQATHLGDCISGTESTVKSAESELVMLKDVVLGSWGLQFWSEKANYQVRYLMDKMWDAMKKAEQLERPWTCQEDFFQ